MRHEMYQILVCCIARLGLASSGQLTVGVSIIELCNKSIIDIDFIP